MPKTNDLDFARLTDWLEGHLTDEETRAVEAQIAAADERGQADVAWLRAFLQVSQAVTLADPPAEVRPALRRRFEEYAQDRRRSGLLPRLLATLTFDSSMQPAAAGLRSATAPETQRQLVYTTDKADIAVNLQRNPNQRFDLNGQVFPTGDIALDSFSVQLLRDSQEVGLTVTDDLGEFTFEAISLGIYELIIGNDQFEALIALAV